MRAPLNRGRLKIPVIEVRLAKFASSPRPPPTGQAPAAGCWSRGRSHKLIMRGPLTGSRSLRKKEQFVMFASFQASTPHSRHRDICVSPGGGQIRRKETSNACDNTENGMAAIHLKV